MNSDNCFVGAILGARRSGKTTLASDLLLGLWRYRFSMVVVVSRTIPMQADFWKHVAGTGVLLIQEFDMSVLEKLKDYMSENQEQGEVLILLDDIGREAAHWARRIRSKQGTEDVLTYLAYASRHYNISCLYLSQDLTQISCGSRKNFDFIICLEASIRDQELIYIDLLANMFPGDCKAFKKYYRAHTGDFRYFLVYKERGRYLLWPEASHAQTHNQSRGVRPAESATPVCQTQRADASGAASDGEADQESDNEADPSEQRDPYGSSAADGARGWAASGSSGWSDGPASPLAARE